MSLAHLTVCVHVHTHTHNYLPLTQIGLHSLPRQCKFLEPIQLEKQITWPLHLTEPMTLYYMYEKTVTVESQWKHSYC